LDQRTGAAAPTHTARRSTGEAQPKLDQYPEVMRVSEVARVLRLSRASIYRAVRDGSLDGICLNRRVLIPKRAVIALLGATHVTKLRRSSKHGKP
jgi:excisionase family DNA binding protein